MSGGKRKFFKGIQKKSEFRGKRKKYPLRRSTSDGTQVIWEAGMINKRGVQTYSQRAHRYGEGKNEASPLPFSTTSLNMLASYSWRPVCQPVSIQSKEKRQDVKQRRPARMSLPGGEETGRHGRGQAKTRRAENRALLPNAR